MAAVYWPDAEVLPVFSALDSDGDVSRFAFDFSQWLADIGWPQLDAAQWLAPGLTISNEVVSGGQALATLASDGSLTVYSWSTITVTVQAGTQQLQRSGRVQLRAL